MTRLRRSGKGIFTEATIQVNKESCPTKWEPAARGGIPVRYEPENDLPMPCLFTVERRALASGLARELAAQPGGPAAPALALSPTLQAASSHRCATRRRPALARLVSTDQQLSTPPLGDLLPVRLVAGHLVQAFDPLLNPGLGWVRGERGRLLGRSRRC